MSSIRPPVVQSAGPREPWRTHLSAAGSAPPAVALKVDNCAQNANLCARHGRYCCRHAERVRVRRACVFCQRQEGKKKKQCPVGIGHLSIGAPQQSYLFKCQGCLSKSDFDCLNRNTIRPGQTYWLPKFVATTRVWSLTCAAWIVNVYGIDAMRHRYAEPHGFICEWISWRGEIVKIKQSKECWWFCWRKRDQTCHWAPQIVTWAVTRHKDIKSVR